jgi:hypothetical protein
MRHWLRILDGLRSGQPRFEPEVGTIPSSFMAVALRMIDNTAFPAFGKN